MKSPPNDKRRQNIQPIFGIHKRSRLNVETSFHNITPQHKKAGSNCESIQRERLQRQYANKITVSANFNFQPSNFFNTNSEISKVFTQTQRVGFE
ncbi:unnamed protein product [Parnassius mnemosyne]|uniref:Uncharacterized protein n=1 Tax=Parnassius mnemosyne TaxID=213953 RepID=A0AAV1L885_9NEOP